MVGPPFRMSRLLKTGTHCLRKGTGAALWCLDFPPRFFRADYFISYARKDGTPYALSLKEKLRKQGVKCRMDTREFFPGQTLSRTTGKNLRRSAALIVVLTPEAGRSASVKSEVDFFVRLGRPIVPVAVDSAALGPASTSEWQTRFSDVIWLNDHDAVTAGDAVVSELKRSLTFVRYRVRMICLGTVIALLTVVLLLIWNVALTQPELSRIRSVPHDVRERFQGYPAFLQAALSSRGAMAAADWDGAVHLFGAGSGQRHELTGMKGFPRGLAFTADGESLLGVAVDFPQVVCWDTVLKQIRWSVVNDRQSGFYALSGPTPEGEFYAADQNCILWRISAAGKVIQKIPVTEPDDWVESIDASRPREGLLVCLRNAGPAIISETGGSIRYVKPVVADSRAGVPAGIRCWV